MRIELRHAGRIACAVALGAAAFLAGCGSNGDLGASTAKLKSSSAVPIGGLHYVSSSPNAGVADIEGITATNGAYDFRPNDTVIFYLDEDRDLPIAAVTDPDAGEQTLLFSNLVTVPGGDPAVFREKLIRTLGSLDSQTAVPGVQIPDEVIQYAASHSDELDALFSADISVNHFVNDLTVLEVMSVAGKSTPGVLSYGDASNVLGLDFFYPFETVYGDVCTGTEPTPGCTFDSTNGSRITVVRDPDYDRYGYGSDDLWYVKFDSSGGALVYNDLGQFQYSADISDFAGYIGGTTIGVGTSGTYWENVANGTYWFGKNGVLYSANSGESRYGQAIN